MVAIGGSPASTPPASNQMTRMPMRLQSDVRGLRHPAMTAVSATTATVKCAPLIRSAARYRRAAALSLVSLICLNALPSASILISAGGDSRDSSSGRNGVAAKDSGGFRTFVVVRARVRDSTSLGIPAMHSRGGSAVVAAAVARRGFRSHLQQLSCPQGVLVEGRGSAFGFREPGGASAASLALGRPPNRHAFVLSSCSSHRGSSRRAASARSATDASRNDEFGCRRTGVAVGRGGRVRDCDSWLEKMGLSRSRRGAFDCCAQTTAARPHGGVRVVARNSCSYATSSPPATTGTGLHDHGGSAVPAVHIIDLRFMETLREVPLDDDSSCSLREPSGDGVGAGVPVGGGDCCNDQGESRRPVADARLHVLLLPRPKWGRGALTLLRNAASLTCVDGAANDLYDAVARLADGGPPTGGGQQGSSPRPPLNNMNRAASVEEGTACAPVTPPPPLPRRIPRSLAAALMPQLLVGDMDSARPEALRYFAARGGEVLETPNQNLHDFEKALDIVAARVAEAAAGTDSADSPPRQPAVNSTDAPPRRRARGRAIANGGANCLSSKGGGWDVLLGLVGRFSGRLDHCIANLHAIMRFAERETHQQQQSPSPHSTTAADPGAADPTNGHLRPRMAAMLTDGRGLAVALPAGHTQVRLPEHFYGGVCGLLPLKGRVRATTRGLKWNLSGDDPLQMGTQISSSNRIDALEVHVHSDDTLILYVEPPSNL
eukprot:GHVU01034696.1.p1 GENE.GHVU01034696.1~~GHVU01034696.1.p1  ORF type:complete len:718 (+),score=75.99 GHVU01034696.1:111-2264(+)